MSDIDKACIEIAKIFKVFKWSWYNVSNNSVYVPKKSDIKEHILYLISELKTKNKGTTWISSGRIRVERDEDYKYTIMIDNWDMTNEEYMIETL